MLYYREDLDGYKSFLQGSVWKTGDPWLSRKSGSLCTAAPSKSGSSHTNPLNFRRPKHSLLLRRKPEHFVLQQFFQKKNHLCVMSLNVNYLGKVIFKPMLVSSFPYYAGGNMIASSRAPSDLYTQLFACDSSPSYLCYSLVACLPFVCCVFPNPPSFFQGNVSIGLWVFPLNSSVWQYLVRATCRVTTDTSFPVLKDWLAPSTSAQSHLLVMSLIEKNDHVRKLIMWPAVAKGQLNIMKATGNKSQ